MHFRISAYLASICAFSVSHETITYQHTHVSRYLCIRLSALSKFRMSMCLLESALSALRAFKNTNVYIFTHSYSRFYHACKHSHLLMHTICIMNMRVMRCVLQSPTPLPQSALVLLRSRPPSYGSLHICAHTGVCAFSYGDIAL
jgi:hypothetical protein